MGKIAETLSPRAFRCPAISQNSTAKCDPEERDEPFCALGTDEVFMFYPETGKYVTRTREELVAMGCDFRQQPVRICTRTSNLSIARGIAALP